MGKKKKARRAGASGGEWVGPSDVPPWSVAPGPHAHGPPPYAGMRLPPMQPPFMQPPHMHEPPMPYMPMPHGPPPFLRQPPLPLAPHQRAWRPPMGQPSGHPQHDHVLEGGVRDDGQDGADGEPFLYPGLTPDIVDDSLNRGAFTVDFLAAALAAPVPPSEARQWLVKRFTAKIEKAQPRSVCMRSFGHPSAGTLAEMGALRAFQGCSKNALDRSETTTPAARHCYSVLRARKTR
eukprot:132113-Chlamydomonas_euryale.AAC.4